MHPPPRQPGGFRGNTQRPAFARSRPLLLTGALFLPVLLALAAAFSSSVRSPARAVLTVPDEQLGAAPGAPHESPRAHFVARSEPSPFEPAVDEPPRALALERCEVSGSVIDMLGGGPLVGALIVARSGEIVAAQATSRADGTFRLPVPQGTWDILARADAYGEALQRVRAPATDVMLTLAPAGEIVGRVVDDATGKGVPGIRVSARHTSHWGAAPALAVSGSDGEFQLRGAFGGSYEIAAQARGWSSTPERVGLELGEVSAPILLRAVRSGVLTATVDVEGLPCEGARVTLAGAVDVLQRTGADGVITFESVVPGTYQVEVQCDGARPHSETLAIEAAPLSRSWSLEHGLTLAGRAETHAGMPLAGASIWVQPLRAGAAQVSCTTGTDGSFACSGLSPGDHECGIAAAPGAAGRRVRVSLGGDTETSVLLRAGARGSIRVRVNGGGPEARPHVLARSAGALTLEAVERDGFHWLEGVPLGRHEVYVGGYSEHANASRTVVELGQDGESVEVTLEAPPAARIEGRVIDARGVGVFDAWVQAHSSDSAAFVEAVPVLTDEEGRFVLTRVGLGEYDLSVMSRSGEARLEAVAAGATGVLVRLVERASLAGRVLDERGGLAPQFIVSFQSEHGPFGSVAGQAGRFVLPWLEPGKYDLTLTSAAGSAASTVELPAGEKLELTWTLDPGVLRAPPTFVGGLDGSSGPSVARE